MRNDFVYFLFIILFIYLFGYVYQYIENNIA
jgi:hypothetical protein